MPGEITEQNTNNGAQNWQEQMRDMPDYSELINAAKAEMATSAANPTETPKEAGLLDRRYVLQEGVTLTPETQEDGTARPETRVSLDQMGNPVVQQVQLEEIEVPQAMQSGEQTEAETEEADDEPVEMGLARSEDLENWMKSLEGTPEEFWQRTVEKEREKGVELGPMPDMRKVDVAIANFFDKGVEGVTGEARAKREAMAQKAVLNDLAKLEARGGVLNDETMRNVFYGAQQMLEAMYRGNRELREDAQEDDLSADEKIAWHLKMDPRDARTNVLLVMQRHTRKVGESDADYEARLRTYAGETLPRERQEAVDQAYDVEHPDEAAEYAAQIARNKQKDDLPEYTYLKWEEVNDDGTVKGRVVTEKVATEKTGEAPVERESRIKGLFEKVRGRLGFRKVMDKVTSKLAEVATDVAAWLEAKSTQGETEEKAVAESAESEGGAGITEAETAETEREKQLRQMQAAKAEIEKRMMRDQGDTEKTLRWAQLVIKLNAKMEELAA